MDKLKKFWKELERRNVLRIALSYLLVALNLLILLHNGFAPVEPGEGFYANFYRFLAAGLVLVCALAWTFERTPAGVVLTEHVERSKSFAHNRGQKLNKVIIGLAALAFLQFLYGVIWGEPYVPFQDKEVSEVVSPEAGE